MMLSIHDQLLLAAISPERFDVPAIFEPSDLLNPELAHLASSNRIGAFLWKLFERPTVKERLDVPSRQQARAAMADTLLLSMKLTREVREVGELLGNAGVEAMIYKGPDIAERCYHRSCPRLYGDLDLVLRPGQVKLAVRALSSAGYRPVPADGPSLEYYRRFHLNAALARPGRLLPVEIHWALNSPYADRPDVIPRLFQFAEPGDALSPYFLRPTPLDLFILMLLHTEKHLTICAGLPSADARLKSVIECGGLIWLLDIIRWLNRYGEQYGATTVTERIRELGADTASVVSLRMASDLSLEPLPDWVNGRATRLSRHPPLITRIVYGDLMARHGSSAPGRRRRAFLLNPLPRLGFRPIRVAQALLPGLSIKDREDFYAHGIVIRVMHWLGIACANCFWIASWIIRRSWTSSTTDSHKQET